jgi:hypothetical protein
MNLKEKLQGHKVVKVCGSKFVIRRINPIMDFPADKMPQIFTSFKSERKTDKTPYSATTILEQMIRVIEAGVVSPELVPVGKADKRGKEDGITAEDLFRDEETGVKLFQEIMLHSLNHYRGLKGVFFSLKNRLTFAINLAKNMATARQV